MWMELIADRQRRALNTPSMRDSLPVRYAALSFTDVMTATDQAGKRSRVD